MEALCSCAAGMGSRGVLEEKVEEEEKELELQMMCESRAGLKRKETLRDLKNSMEEELVELDMMKSLKRSVSKEETFKTKFPAWMTYCPEKGKKKE